uniref:Ig-like domain-containing protein n=1 Tax=Varanus komodoensis TaxID=61221 RepID=A0A8D2J658_VARKO
TIRCVKKLFLLSVPTGMKMASRLSHFPLLTPVQPVVTISPTKDDPLSPCTLLLCTVASFYLREIEIQWLKNSQDVTEVVFYGEELHNGDWTHKTQVMLEDTPQRGDVYTCQVQQASLETPITVQWIRDYGGLGTEAQVGRKLKVPSHAHSWAP